MKRHYRLYLETSFWNRLENPARDLRREISYAFLRAVQRPHHLFISRLVTRELDRIRDVAQRRAVRRRMEGQSLRTITLTARIVHIARELVRLGGWSENVIADMVHVAYAVFGRVDALVTWDFDDLARPRTRDVVSAYGRRQDVPVPLIGSPPEVASWLGIGTRR
jgi:predicted nucleic acid-binding protein